MKKYYLSGEEVGKINRLLENSKAIEGLYDKLYELEINGKKDSDEYKKQIGFLKISIDLENRIYKKYNFSTEKKLVIIKYLIGYKFSKGYIDDEDSIMNQEYDEFFIRRVVRNLLNQVTETKEGFKEIHSDEQEESNKNIDFSMKVVKVLKELNEDIYNSYLLFLQENIDSEDYRCYKNDFIKAKYKLVFIYDKLENKMINNNFTITKDLYLNSKFMSDLYHIDLDTYNFMKDDYCEKISSKQILDFLDVEDLDYNDRMKSISAILRMCYIRACLLMMSNDKIDDVNYVFHDYIEDEEYLNNHSNDTISEKLIISCFKSLKKDRTKVKRLSLKIN